MNLCQHADKRAYYKVAVANYAGATLNFSSEFSLRNVIIITLSFALGRAIL